MVPDVVIRPAVEADAATLVSLIRALAEYEGLLHEVVVTEDRLRASLFSDPPVAEAALAWVGTTPVGFALWFHNYSTFLGRAGLHLEDLFVVPEWRRRGIGRRLLAHVAAIAVRQGAGRLEWSVLDWNEPAIRVYRALGARAMDEWTVYRLTGQALKAAAAHQES
jgi:GNAT superfamily N-acetyltransferase